MKVLFLCMTEFQLLTALNAKCHLLSDCEADIIVGNYHGEEDELAKRIRQTNLFRVVCAVNSGIEERTIHAYLRGISDGIRTITLKEALENTIKYTICRVGEKITGPKVYLSTSIKNYNTLTWRDYDSVYAFGTRPLTRRIIMRIKEVNPKCTIVQMDEGPSSYCHDNVGGFSISDECLLYEPKALIFDRKTVKMPRLSREDHEFIDLINLVFDVNEDQIESYSGGVIYFDQGVEGSMPPYLKNAKWLKKIIFYNAYKRHMKENYEYQLRSKNTKKILALFKEKKIWIKPHPRSSADVMKSYEDLGKNIKVMSQYHIPWEVIALNTNLDNALLMTTTSGSVFLYPSVFEDTQNSKSIILYKMLQYKVDKEFDLCLEKMQEIYNNDILVPKTYDEFVDIIKQ